MKSVIFGDSGGRKAQEFASDLFGKVEKMRDTILAYYIQIWAMLWATTDVQIRFPGVDARGLKPSPLTLAQRVTATGAGLGELMTLASSLRTVLDDHLATLSDAAAADLLKRYPMLARNADGHLELPGVPAGQQLTVHADGSGTLADTPQPETPVAPAEQATPTVTPGVSAARAAPRTGPAAPVATPAAPIPIIAPTVAPAVDPATPGVTTSSV